MTDDTTLDNQDNQVEIKKPERDELGRLLPGNTANPAGRPKGKTMKEFAREFLMTMNEYEKMEWMKGLSKSEVWRMAEGNPAQDVTSGGEKLTPVPIYGGNSIPKHDSDKKDIPSV